MPVTLTPLPSPELGERFMTVEKTKPKCVLCYSGGLDSTVLLYSIMMRDGYEVYTITVDYGQRHDKEISAASMIQHELRLGSRAKLIDLSHSGTGITELFRGSGSSQIGESLVPDGHYTDETMRSTIVPNRNMILLSLATAWAISLKAEIVAYAAHAGDHTIYPDCRKEFVVAMREAMSLCDWNPPRLNAPFRDMTKADIVKLGAELGVPFEKTYSCLTGDTEIITLNGTKLITDIKPGEWVWGYTDDGWTPSQVQEFMNQGVKHVYEITLKDRIGKVTSFKATKDHLLMMSDGGYLYPDTRYIRVDKCRYGTSLMNASIHVMTVNRNRPSGNKTYLAVKPHNDWQEKDEYLHRIAARFFGYDLSGDVVVHHKDNDTFNNTPENLEVLPRGEHSKLTDRKKMAGTVKGNRLKSSKKKVYWESLSPEEYKALCAKISKGKAGKRINHKVVSIRYIGEEPTYDIQTTTENFALASGIFVHNCYKGGAKHCGRCGTCTERREAFILAGIPDTTIYEE